MANTYKNAAVALSTTAATDLYTAPANTRAIVQSVNVANVDGSDRYVTVTWYDYSIGQSYTLLYNGFVPAGTSLNALDTPLVLEPGDVVRVQASAANTLHATASVLQIDSTTAFPDGAVTTAKLADGSVTLPKFGSNLLPVIICTSTTRPSSPTEGQQIYETNTDRQLVWNASVWAAPQVQAKPPMCINERTGQVINDSTVTAIAFTSAASVDTETPTAIHSTSTNNTRFTARTVGVYQFHGSVVNSPAVTIDVTGTIALRKNGTTEVANASLVSNAYGQNASVSALVDMSVGDYVELIVYQDNAANQTRTFTGRMQCALIGQKS